MSIKFVDSEITILNMKTRMPFKYGIATLTALPHLFLKIDFEIDGKSCSGIAAEGLAPKWFTKDPDTSFEFEIDQMIKVIAKAVTIAKTLKSSSTVFDYWLQLYKNQQTWGKEIGLPGLLSSLGSSMFERALISAYCNAKEKPFHSLIDQLGIKLEEINSELDSELLMKVLPDKPLKQLEVRHTVGLADYLFSSDIPDEELLNDGLPQSLEDNLIVYGIKKLKIKLSGDLRHDIERLIKISTICRELDRDISFTLDGNEQFKNAMEFKKYWLELSSIPSLKHFFDCLLFIEQPIHRDFALNDETGECFTNWQDCPKIIIDESDSDLLSARRALELGYSGTSHKNCKGIFKSIANACLIYSRNDILSAEDLCNVGPVALLQDLAVVAALGIGHVERNGHQYMTGLSMYPEEFQQEVLIKHGDLYKSHHGFPSLDINHGSINLGSVNSADFGLCSNLNYSVFTALKNWSFESLNNL